MATTPNTNDLDVEELLPWYVNGTLTENEEAAVRRFIQDKEQAARDVELLRHVRDAVRSEEFGSPGEFGLRRLKAAISEDPGRGTSGGSSGRWWRPAMAAAVLVIAVQAVLLVDAWRRGGVYEPAGTATERPTIQLRFDPGATEKHIRELFNDLEVEIVRGPSSVGVYRVVPVQEGRDVEQIITRLRRAEHIVTFAEIE